MDAASVGDVWRRSHQASAMTLVVSAPVVPEVILAATRSIGAPESERAPPLDAPAPHLEPAPPVQTLRTWLGLAFSHFPVDDVHGAVVALLVTAALESTRGDFETSVELRELPDRWMLTILGAAYPGQARAMRSAVSTALATTLETLDPSEVRAAVARVEQSLRLGARTPAGLVEAVGRSAEATGDPGSAAHRMEQLGRVDAESVRGTLRALLERGPVRAEVGR
jgi:predicted Zn-dependent peptidase